VAFAGAAAVSLWEYEHFITDGIAAIVTTTGRERRHPVV